MKTYPLIDNSQKKQYEFHIDSHISKIEYNKTDDNKIFLTHTEVPEALRGRGIASQLTEAVFADIEKKGLIVVPVCPFIKTYIKEHPQWQHLV